MIQQQPQYVYVPVQQPEPVQFFRPTPIPEDQFTPLGFMAATLTISSAATIGANMVDVRNGTMSHGKAVVNGIAKGVAATVILSLTPKQTVVDIALTAAALAGTGYAIDRVMKRTKDQICEIEPDE